MSNCHTLVRNFSSDNSWQPPRIRSQFTDSIFVSDWLSTTSTLWGEWFYSLVHFPLLPPSSLNAIVLGSLVPVLLETPRESPLPKEVTPMIQMKRFAAVVGAPTKWRPSARLGSRLSLPDSQRSITREVRTMRTTTSGARIWRTPIHSKTRVHILCQTRRTTSNKVLLQSQNMFTMFSQMWLGEMLQRHTWMLLQETLLLAKQRYTMAGYMVYRNDSYRGRRTVILIKGTLQHHWLIMPADPQLTAAISNQNKHGKIWLNMDFLRNVTDQPEDHPAALMPESQQQNQKLVETKQN